MRGTGICGGPYLALARLDTDRAAEVVLTTAPVRPRVAPHRAGSVRPPALAAPEGARHTDGIHHALLLIGSHGDEVELRLRLLRPGAERFPLSLVCRLEEAGKRQVLVVASVVLLHLVYCELAGFVVRRAGGGGEECRGEGERQDAEHHCLAGGCRLMSLPRRQTHFISGRPAETAYRGKVRRGGRERERYCVGRLTWQSCSALQIPSPRPAPSLEPARPVWRTAYTAHKHTPLLALCCVG